MTTLAALLATTRLLSLTGTGGVGKTRLARELARSVVDRFPDGVWSVELAPLREARLVARAVAVVLDVGETPGRPLLAALVSALRARRMLLVLDNCEHLLDGCASVVGAMLAGCPDVRVLVTSRQSLGITGELNWRVPSLASPTALDTDPAQLGRHDAVRLFLDRASAVDPTFALTGRNARAVAQLCRRLDGIPLALELAAARLNALGVEQLAARLDRRFTLLSSGSRTAPPRHQTLRATIDWSYDLLDSLERLLFRRLSVFVGGWTLEAAEAVGAGERIDASNVLDLLARLVDKSLVLAEEQPDGGRRYRMLETLREYARERLEASGALGAVEECHARYYLCLTNGLEPELASGRRDAALATLEAEHDNLRRALGWCRDGDGRAVAVGLTIAWNLFWFWYLRGYLLEGFRWAEALLARSSGVAPDIRALALSGAGRMAWLLGEDAAARLRLRECAALWREIGDERGLANALIVLGMETEEPSEAWSQLTQGEATFRADGDKWGLALALRLQGLWAFQHGDEETARARMEEGLALSRQVGDRWFIAQTLNHLGDLARRQADYARAEARYEESLALFRAQGVLGGIPNLLHNLGHVALARGDVRARRPTVPGESAALPGSGRPARRCPVPRGVSGRAGGATPTGPRRAPAWRGRGLSGRRQRRDGAIQPDGSRTDTWRGARSVGRVHAGGRLGRRADDHNGRGGGPRAMVGGDGDDRAASVVGQSGVGVLGGDAPREPSGSALQDVSADGNHDGNCAVRDALVSRSTTSQSS